MTNGWRGGKRRRERCTGKLAEDKELGGISEGGERKGPWPSVEGKSSTLINRTDLSDWVAAVLGLEKPPNNEQAI